MPRALAPLSAGSYFQCVPCIQLLGPTKGFTVLHCITTDLFMQTPGHWYSPDCHVISSSVYPGLVCASAFVVQGYCASMCFRFPPPSQCHQYVKPLSFGAIIRTARDGASRCTLGLRQRQPIKMSALTESLTANSVVTTLRHRLATAIFSSPAALLAPLVPLWL